VLLWQREEGECFSRLVDSIVYDADLGLEIKDGVATINGDMEELLRSVLGQDQQEPFVERVHALVVHSRALRVKGRLLWSLAEEKADVERIYERACEVAAEAHELGCGTDHEKMTARNLCVCLATAMRGAPGRWETRWRDVVRKLRSFWERQHPDHKEGAMKLLLEVEAFLQSGGEELHALSFGAPGTDDSALPV
jgi:hypothetical protein